MESSKGKLELIGVLTVVLSLLFVAYEIRQNTNTAAAQAVIQLNEAGRQTLFLQSADPGLTEYGTHNSCTERPRCIERRATA